MAGKKNSGMLCKVVKLELKFLKKESGEDYPYQYELPNLQKMVSKAKNRTVQACWEWYNFEVAFTQENKIHPNIKDYTNNMSLDGYINKIIKPEFKNMYSQNLSAAVRSACAAFGKAKKEIKKGTRSVLSYREDCPIEIHNKRILLYNEGQKYYVSLCLFSEKYAKAHNYFDEKKKLVTSLPFEIFRLGGSRQAIVRRCMSGEYKIGESELVYKKGKWFLNLAYEFKPEKSTDFVEGRVMGVDLGIKCVAYMSFNDCEARDFIGYSQIYRFRAQMEARRRELQRQGKYCGEGRIGHGYETRNKPVLNLGEAEANFRDTLYHRYSHYIVEFAIKNKCGIIQMEDLRGISTNHKFLNGWLYNDLQQKIEYKAKAAGMEVYRVKPQYTSQRCSRCGYISAENRPKEEKGQAYFRCVECDFKENADYNASQNLATAGIEQIIDEDKPRAKTKRTKKD